MRRTDFGVMKKLKKMMILLLSILVIVAVGIGLFVSQPSFGRFPRGERLKRIKKSAHYKKGQFQNELPTTTMTGNKSTLRALWEFLTVHPDNLEPSGPVPSVKTDLATLALTQDQIVWFGHSAYLLQLGGKRILVDPALVSGAPVAFLNKPYPGTDLYKPEDLPEIDYLIISHDHWDHLDYQTVRAIKERVKHVITPLGIGEYFEYWGYPVSKLTELDWYESADVDGFTFHCLPARHFSGRGLKPNKTLWGSFVVETPAHKKVYIGGDSGYSTHFKWIAEHYPNLDLAILENGQYNEDWNQIHTMPHELTQEMKELGAKTYVTVHHSKFTLSKHAWDEPLAVEKQAAREANVALKVLTIGKPEEIQ